MGVWRADQFAILGYFLQLAATNILGAPLSAQTAASLMLIPSLALGGWFAKILGYVFPKNVTTAISERSYGRKKGVITVGTARHGNPAQARLTDGHGNFHYVQVEPFDPEESLPQGTQVLIVRQKGGTFKAVRLS